MNSYSATQFACEVVPEIHIDDNFLSEARSGDYCFVEDTALLPYEAGIERMIIFQWNRVYPADMYFDIPLLAHGWKCKETEEFTGNSHERITMEVYER